MATNADSTNINGGWQRYAIQPIVLIVNDHIIVLVTKSTMDYPNATVT